MRHEQLANVPETALLVVDIQEKLLARMEHRDALTAQAGRLIEAAKILEVPVVVTEQYPKGLGPTDAAIAESLGDFTPLEKTAFSCLGDDAVRETLKTLGRKRIVLTGIETHICVQQTALDLLAHGYTVYLPRDASCSRGEADHLAGLERMRGAGVILTTAESILFELLQQAGTAKFKAMLPLFK